MFSPLAIGHILTTLRTLEHSANIVDLFERVEASASRGFLGLWSLACERKLAQIGVADADQRRRLAA